MAGRHRKPASPRMTIPAVVAGGIALAAAAPAHASPDWDRLASCESSGNWQINNGNGFFGGLQFHPTTWAAFGGTAFAPSADLATREQQIEIAEKVLATQGEQAWPDCSNRVVPGWWDAAPAPPPAPPVDNAAVMSTSQDSQVVRPTFGEFTSGRGERWGVMHHGIDIANAIGTPVVAAYDGTVIDAGPASGFGQWIRIRQDNGRIQVYGHVEEMWVAPGQRVSAGEQIATMGNRGQSTGPHLHFEVREPDGSSIDPIGWLQSNGVDTSDWSAPSPEPTPIFDRLQAETEVGAPVHDALAAEYTVVPGDWLSKIAAEFGVAWQQVYEVNADQIADPNLIYPGQVLRMP